MNRSHLLKLLVGLLATGYGPSYAETNTYASDLARLEKVEKESIQADLRTEDAARTIAAAYQELFGNVDALSVKDRPDILKTMFAAASTTALHTNSSSHANTMRTYYDLLKSAGYPDIAWGAGVYGAYVAAEEFEAASQFAALNPDLKVAPLPATIEQLASGARQEWNVSPSGDRLVSSESGIPSGAYLIVVSSIHCHFSLDSMRALAKSSELGKLSQRMKWLMRIDRGTNFAEVAQWNHQHPSFRFSVPKKYKEWTEITSWDTPTFYFFNDGRLVY